MRYKETFNKKVIKMKNVVFLKNKGRFYN